MKHPRRVFTLLFFAFVLIACGPGSTTPADTTKPTVTLGTPNTTITTAGTITLTATASDNVGVSKVEFFDGTFRLGEDSSATDGFTQTVTLGSSSNGSKTYTAKAFDAAGNTASGTVTVNINIPPKGALSVTFGNLPANTPGSANVTGPNGFQLAVSGTTVTLSDLNPGSYTVSSNPVRVNKSVVDQIFEATPNSANLTVTAETTTKHTIDHAQRPGTGALWIPTSNGFLKGYTDAQLALTGAVEPLESRVQAGFNDQIVFDKNGKLYSSNPQFSTINGPTTLQGAATKLKNPRGMAFDKNGNLWVANPGALFNASDDSILAFTAAQLAQGGNLAPSIVLTSTSFQDPIGLAFDFNDTLWVSNYSASASVFGLAPDALKQTASVVRSTSVIAVSSPTGVAVDSAGNLWIASDSKTILQYTKSQLVAGGAAVATPNLTLTGFDSTPRGLAFDNAGNLWVVLAAPGNDSIGNLEEILAANLGGTGSVVRQTARSITGYGSVSIGMPAFNPTPSNLPIQNK